MEIKIYGSNECPYCVKLKKYLSVLRVKYEYIDIDNEENNKIYQNIVKDTNNSFIPVVQIDGKLHLPERDFDSIPQIVKKILLKKSG